MRTILASTLVLAACLAGCSSDSSSTSFTPVTPTPSPVVGPTNLQGVVQSGGTATPRPLAGVPVTLFEAGAGEPVSLATSTTDAAGRFTLNSPKTATTGTFYVVARPGPGVSLVTVAGPTLPPALTVNELTTVAASYSMAWFMEGGRISGPPLSLRIAAGMNDNLVVPATGASSSVLLNPPNADQTNSLRSTRSLANALAGSLEQPAQFLTLTSATDTAQGLANLARNPARNVSALYTLARQTGAYTPGLERQPDAWTVAVKVNDSGDPTRLISGMGNIEFDAEGNAWVDNNTIQNQTQSSDFIVVFQPNGKPAPFSPVVGGGILGTGYGVDIDGRGNVWIGNFGWGGVNPGPQGTGTGSISLIAPNGVPISGPQGIDGGTDRAQGIRVDSLNNVWIASFGNDRLVVFPGGDPSRSFFFQGRQGSAPFDIGLNPDGSAWMAYSGGLDGQNGSSIGHYTIVNGTSLRQDFAINVGTANKGMVSDRFGNGWFTSQEDSTINAFRPDGSQIGAFKGGSIIGPWGVATDGDDHIWVANFDLLKRGNDFTNARITQLVGANPATRPPGTQIGDQLSPPTGYNMPSAGAPVTLANGQPLYGVGGPPAFTPLQRLTKVKVDRAGNIWCLNNWKPNFDFDVLKAPGGDGMVIFVGLARPVLDQ